MSNKALEKKVLRTYKNWGIYHTAATCGIKKERVREILKSNGVEERKRGWKWRREDFNYQKGILTNDGN